jgi:hypothetical protein
MEKRKAHYDLDLIKQVVNQAGIDTFTRTAKDNSRLMGLTEADAVAVVKRLHSTMLFKA